MESVNTSMRYHKGSNNETSYLWSHMPEPWQTILFIYMGCIKLREPVMLSELKRMAETGKMPYRSVCTHLYTTDRTFRVLSHTSIYFKMSGSTNLRNYNKKSYPIIFRDHELPSCKIMWKKACEMYVYFGLNGIDFPPISAYSYVSTLCQKVLPLDDDSSQGKLYSRILLIP
jgi:hypothetical protein